MSGPLPPIVHGDLFSGIGGFALAARWMGWTTAWFSEIDPYASAVLAKHWPGVPNHGDITRIDFHSVEPVDLLCGGFPCQDISNAGKREGITGERSGLWSEYARAIGELRPRYVVVENVAALLGRGLDRVLGDLSTLGYDAEWTVLSAADVGAPHLRERVWVVAYPADAVRRAHARRVAGRQGAGGGEARDRPICEGLRHPEPDGSSAGGEALEHASRLGRGEGRAEPVLRRGWFTPARTGGGFWSDGEWRRGHDGSVRLIRPGLRLLGHGIPRRVERIRGLGNAIVPQCAFQIFRAIAAAEQRRLAEAA